VSPSSYVRNMFMNTTFLSLGSSDCFCSEFGRIWPTVLLTQSEGSSLAAKPHSYIFVDGFGYPFLGSS
jgi:hypothetical protein